MHAYSLHLHTGWQLNLDASDANETRLILYRVGPSKSTEMAVTVVFSLTITCNFNWSLYYLGECIDVSRCSLFNGSPALLNNIVSLKSILDKIENCKVCVGNPDEKFDLLVELRQGNFLESVDMRN